MKGPILIDFFEIGATVCSASYYPFFKQNSPYLSSDIIFIYIYIRISPLIHVHQSTDIYTLNALLFEGYLMGEVKQNLRYYCSLFQEGRTGMLFTLLFNCLCHISRPFQEFDFFPAIYLSHMHSSSSFYVDI